MYGIYVAGDKVGNISINQSEEQVVEYLDSIMLDNSKNISYVEKNIEIKKEYVSKETNEYLDYTNLGNGYEVVYSYFKIFYKDEYICLVQNKEDIDYVVNTLNNEYITFTEETTSNSSDIDSQVANLSADELVNFVNEQIDEIEEKILLASAKSIEGVIIKNLPVEGVISSRYGESSRLRRSTHTGLDIAAVSGTPIVAVSDGVVTKANYEGSYGNLVVLDHGNGVQTYYGHCSTLLVKPGETVKAGQVIAKVGSTGNSTGPHLHFEIRLNDVTVNPQDYLYN